MVAGSVLCEVRAHCQRRGEGVLMYDYAVIADILAMWWAEDEDPAEIVARLLGEVWEGDLDQLVLAAMKQEDRLSALT